MPIIERKSPWIRNGTDIYYSAGNVGIGTTGPDRLLTLVTSDTSANPALHIRNDQDNINADSSIHFQVARSANAAGQDWTMGIDASIGNNYFQLARSNALGINVELVVDTNGNVGINTTGPDRKLDILDAVNPQLRLTQTDGTVYADFHVDSNGDLVIAMDGQTNQLVLDNAGNVGIGTAAPVQDLHIHEGSVGSYSLARFTTVDTGSTDADGVAYGYDSASGFAVGAWNKENTALVFATNNSERVRIDNTGIVGIGTPSPNASSILHLSTTTKGFLPPVMTTTQRDAITSPATGLVIFNSTTGVLEFYNGTVWGGV